MKSIIIYNSLTGNTKQIAEAIQSGMSRLEDDVKIIPMKDMNPNELRDYDLIGLGSYARNFQEPEEVTAFLNAIPALDGKYGFTFCTHGTCAGGYMARMVAALREKGLTVTGWNDWYGGGFFPFTPKPYYTDNHPDKIDLQEAKDFGREVIERSRKISGGETRLIPELPGKEEYDRLYGTPDVPRDQKAMEEVGKLFMVDMVKLKPVYNAEKCNYPKCTICIDNCPTHSIDLSGSPQISHVTCGPCPIWFCEQLCPTGAIEVDWEPVDRVLDSINIYLDDVARPLNEYKDLRRFRNLITQEEGSGTPLYKRKEHPRLVIHEGVVTENVK